MSTIREPVSRPISTSEGVRGTAGRPLPKHLVAERQPQLGDDARQLLEMLPTVAKSQMTPQTLLDFAESVARKPSRPGVQALAYLAWSCREAVRKRHPENADAESALADFLDSRGKTITALLDFTASIEAREQKVIEVAKAAIAEGYKAGIAAGQEELRKQLPAVVRETTFTSDKDGRIIGKTEREFKPGGKS